MGNNQLPSIKTSVCQMEVIPGRPDINSETILKEINDARSREVDLIVFPEMCISGYLIADLYEDEGFIKDVCAYNKTIAQASKDITVVWGNLDIDVHKINEDGRIRKYNSVFMASNKKMLVHRTKTLLPNYRIFDDERHFHSLRQFAQDENLHLHSLLTPTAVNIKNQKVKIGLSICEDIWHADYAFNPVHALVTNGAQIIVNVSCSPWTWKKNQKRHAVVSNLINSTRVPLIYCNNVGIQNNGKNIVVFDGASTVYNADGTIRAQAEPYKAQTLDVIMDSRSEKVTDVLPKDSKALYDAMIYGTWKFLRDQLNKRTAVVGISGGIDSAVVAVILTRVLGADNVIGVNMPTQYNSDTTKNAATKLAKNLGIKYYTLPIQPFYENKVTAVQDFIKYMNKTHGTSYSLTDLDRQNIQARERGSGCLAAIAAVTNSLFINTANKTETAFGYCTMYGDMAGAFSPIADLYKREVYQIAEHINYIYHDVIPGEIINLVPSAELSFSQDVDAGKGDPFKYEYHDQLVRALVEFRVSPETILQWYSQGKNILEKKLHMPIGTLSKFFKSDKTFINDLREKCTMITRAHFKRVQAPPILLLSKRAFGYDLREARLPSYCTRNFIKLENKILENSSNNKPTS